MQNKKNPKKRKRVIQWNTLIILAGIIAMSISTIYIAYKHSVPVDADVSYNEFMKAVDNNEIESVNIIKSQKYFTATFKDGTKATVINPEHDEFKKELLEKGVNISVQTNTALEAVSDAVLTIPTMALIFVFIWYMLKAFGGQTNTLYKLYKAEEVVKFDQVAGMSETKDEVKFAVSQLRNASKLKKLGTKPCKGIILEGPPGTGKTLLAKAIAGEANVPFISTNGADFVEMFAGLGAARVRKLWDLAELNAPCVVFIDEIDAVGRRRSGGSDGATTEANQTLNELLSKMDGLSPNLGVFVVGATNRIQDLDPALIRPGRFDKRIYIGPPKTKKDRDEIVELYLKNKKLDKSVTVNMVSRMLFGMTGAEIEQALNESVMVSIQRGGEGVVTLADIDAAAMKIRTLGGIATRHSSKEDIRISSVHEAGHAIVSCLVGRKVSKISITSYNSGVGGVTIRDTDDIEDIKIASKRELENEIRVLLAGRAAEKLMFGEVSAGCSNDIERATVIAYKMLYNYAMQDDYLINPEVLSDTKPILLDSKEMLKNVNEMLLVYNKQVADLLEARKDELIRLSNQLSEEENVYDYTYESCTAKE